MPRTKTGIIRRRSHKAVLARTKGFRMTKNRLIRVAKEADLHAGQYAFAGRRLRRRDLRSLWITRISAGVKLVDQSFNYSRFMQALKTAKIMLDRKILAQLAATDFESFSQVVKKAMK